MRKLRIGLAMLVVTALTLSACSRGSTAAEDVEDVVRRSIDAENAKDVSAFLALWTDQGLEAYDVGSREDLESGQAEGFGSERMEIVEFSDTTVEGDEAQTTVDAMRGESNIVKPVFRVKFLLLDDDGSWKLNGFEFVGSPPPAAGAAVVELTGAEYAFAPGASEAPGNMAIRLKNIGKEPHEISLFKGPDGVDVETARKALENVDGRELSDVPAGYTADHLTFAEPGQTTDTAFAEPVAAGTYVLACFLPEGGFTEQGEPVNPEGKPHIQLGMIAMLTVT